MLQDFLPQVFPVDGLIFGVLFLLAFFLIVGLMPNERRHGSEYWDDHTHW